MKMKSTTLLLHVLVLAGTVSLAGAQAPRVHGASRLAALSGNAFYRLTADGTQILVNHSPDGAAEELVMLPRDGMTEQLWIRAPGRRIYNRIAVSGDGNKVAFAYAPGSEVHVLDRAGGAPRSIANVGPDGDVRQLVLSDDGALAAFTASRYRDPSGQLVRVRTNLYVAATDGGTLTKITAEPMLEKFIPFVLSGDGKTLVWVDDRNKGAWIAGVDGANAKRLPAPPAGRAIQAVFCNTTATVVYYQTVAGDGVKLHEVDRARSTLALRHEGPLGGIYALSRDGARVHVLVADPAESGTRTWWRVTGSGLAKVAAVSWPRHLGSWTWSGDGGTLVWRAAAATHVWRATQP